MKNIHVLAIPYPAQGYVTPLMEASRCFTNNGLNVTFVNTDFTHKRVMSACSQMDGPSDHLMRIVSIPDGMEPCDDRSDLGKFTKTMFQLTPAKLEELINDINKNDEDKITCLVADYYMGWVVRVARKMGVPMKDQMIQLSNSMPFMDPRNFIWACVGDSATNKIIFDFVVLDGKEPAEAAYHIICNSTMDLEPGAFALFPKLLLIGLLLATNRSARQVGHFWNEYSTCLAWLDINNRSVRLSIWHLGASQFLTSASLKSWR
ncbi:hypothetical protein L1987_46795 [Smallanthus sonchifolius]|uniref:Uncharacterized protein n=1 Tax=Smallanthus sonchifolius TaxID=185202 RepID=A0ACB9G0K4_9ASTR|nr:hypothetical protein L1987_46795 [Smallanthus sonchifolius]